VPVTANCWFANSTLHDIITNRKPILSGLFSVPDAVFGAKKMAVVNFTEARIRDLELGSGIWRDEQVKGLMVICHATTKSYAVQGDVRRNGRHVRTVRVKIDRVDRIGLREARRKAKELMSVIQSGVEPCAPGVPTARGRATTPSMASRSATM
jgi:hypothetical protein